MIKKQTNDRMMRPQVSGALLASALLATIAAHPLRAQVQAQPPNFTVPGGQFRPTGPTYSLPPIPPTPAATANGTVVEDVIARVNDQVITRSEYERAQQQLVEDARRQNMSPDEFQERSQNMLRDMIDQQILLSKGKELGISGDAETMRQLDEIRKQNHLESMEALEKAAASQGVSYEDFRQNIKNSVITQQVVRDEVGRRVSMTRADEAAYYNAHAKEFEVPEQVHLSEILIPTPENATDAQISEAQAKADALEAKLKGGANFAEVAKSSSGGPTASAGGDLGDFKRGSLGDVLEKATFSLPVGGFTEPIRTRQGFVILRVDTHQAAGVPPLAEVEPQVQQALYMTGLQPALRKYLTTARDENYVIVKPGFTDSGTSKSSTTTPLFTAYAPPPLKKKVIKHQAAEQKKAERAQEQLAAARAKVAQKNEAKAAALAAKNGGSASVQKVSSKPSKPPKIHREKIRYGQAPRNALPPSLTEQADATPSNPPLVGQAVGAVMAPTDATTTISVGTGVDPDNPLAPAAGPAKKTRFSDRQREHEEQIAQTNLVKAEAKASARPAKATAQENSDEKVRAQPLGLSGDTTKKQKVKRKKGEAKERIQDRQAPVETPVSPTVNPSLGATPVAPSSNTPQSVKDQTSLPPADAQAPGALPAGQPIPSVTGTQPNAPSTVPSSNVPPISKPQQ